jgi:LruC domain-containing protein
MVFDDITTLNLIAVTEKPVFNIQINFASPVTLDQVTTPPYNPFIVVNNASRGTEVHLPNYRPTDLVDASLLGSAQDKSAPGLNRYYISDDDMPFAILIPGNFDFPTESVRISDYYPRFLQWAKSLGVDYPDWYLYKR